MSNTSKTCFVIMPFSDMDGYDSGHFSRVYNHFIKPACVEAGLDVVRGDEVKATNYIAVDILQRIINSDIVICDLSGRNANVMYELGMRQAFDLPVVLLKDRRTERIFDIQGIRTLDYNEALRVDSVEHERNMLVAAISATLKLESHEVNSLVGLLGVEKASLGKPTQVSAETSLILTSLKDISSRLERVEEILPQKYKSTIVSVGSPSVVSLKSSTGKDITNRDIALSEGIVLTVGDELYDHSNSSIKSLGTLIGFGKSELLVKPLKGEVFSLTLNEARDRFIDNIPF